MLPPVQFKFYLLHNKLELNVGKAKEDFFGILLLEIIL